MATSKAFNIKILLALQDKISKQLDKPQKRVKNFGAAVAGSIGAGLILATKSAIEFESGMRNANTMMKLSEEQFAAVKKEALDLATRVPIELREIPDVMFDIASLGLDASKSLETIATAAVAGNAPLQVMTQHGAAIVNAFAEIDEADLPHVFDVTQAAVERAGATMEDYTANMGKIIPFAKGIGASFEEMAGAFAFVTTQGVNAAEASTAVARAYEGLGRHADKLAKENIRVFDEMGQFRDLGAIMQDMADKYGNLSDEAKTAALQQIGFEAEASKAVIAYMSNVEGLKAALEDTSTATGRVTAAMAEQMKDPQKALTLLKNTVLALMTEFGEPFAQVLAEIALKLQGVIDKVRSWDAETKDMAVKIGLIAGALGGLAAVLPTVVAALAALSGPLGIVLAAIGLVSGAVLYFKGELDAAKRNLDGMATSIPPAAEALEGTLKKAADEAAISLEDVNAALETMGELVPGFTINLNDGEESVEDLGETAERTSEQLRGMNDVLDLHWKRAETNADRVHAALKREYEQSLETADGVTSLGKVTDDTFAEMERNVETFTRSAESSTSRWVGEFLEGANLIGSSWTDLWRGIADAAIQQIARIVASEAFRALGNLAFGSGSTNDRGFLGFLGFHKGGVVPSVPRYASGGVHQIGGAMGATPALLEPGELVLPVAFTKALKELVSRGPKVGGGFQFQASGPTMAGAGGGGASVTANFYSLFPPSVADKLALGRVLQDLLDDVGKNRAA